MNMLNKTKLIILGSLLLAITSFNSDPLVAAHPFEVKTETNLVETRCGWFQNPTPANAWLNDKDGEWIIGIQGGEQAEGDWPNFTDKQWVKTNGNYGYGCACLNVSVNRQTKEVIKIKSATAKPLSTCRKDKALKEPKD